MAIFLLQWWQGKCLRRKCFDCHAIRLLVNSRFWPLESREDLIQLKISEGLVSSQLLGSNIIPFKGKTMSISFHQRRNVEISNHTLEKRWGDCCRVRMGESLLCLSALLCQSVPQLLAYFLPPRSVTGPFICRKLDKRHEVYGKNICSFIQTPLCNATRESHI